MATSLACPQSRVLCKSHIGEVFRSGCTFTRGYGKIFYFHPGHETGNSFFNPNVIRVIKNAIYWAKPIEKKNYRASECVEPLEEVR